MNPDRPMTPKRPLPRPRPSRPLDPDRVPRSRDAAADSPRALHRVPAGGGYRILRRPRLLDAED